MRCRILHFSVGLRYVKKDTDFELCKPIIRFRLRKNLLCRNVPEAVEKAKTLESQAFSPVHKPVQAVYNL